ncbi:phage tail tape measure protein [Coprococcus comes]|jgi:TP901 family phage tail tape measure protein|uniref:phage tail tape measure protein n=1 Tax=Coprococcus comes TaxID=410072 RepID=UPI003D7BF9AE
MDLFKLVGTIAIDTAKAEKSLDDVSKQVNDTEKVVSEGCDKVKESSEKAGSSAEKAGRKVEESGKKGRKAGEDNKKSGEETEKSGNKWVEFGKKVEAAGTKVTGVGKKISSAGGEVVKLGKKFAPVSAAATGALTVVTKTSSDFQNGMAKMSTLFDTSQVSVQKLSKEFLNLSNETGKGATELTEAGYQALSASVPVEKLGSFIRTSANMAKVGFTDTATSVDLLSTAVNAYGLEADQADNIANKLVNTQNLGKTSVNELASSMGKVIPTAAGMNVNLDQLCTMYTLMTKQGIATAESTTYMNSMLNELGDSGTDVGEILKEKTGKSFQDLMKDGMSVGDALKLIKQSSDETGTAFNELWSSQEAGKAAMALLNDSAGDFNETMGSMANVTDLVSQGLEKMDTPSAKVSKSLNRIKNSGVELGSVLLTTVTPYIEVFSQKVIELTNKFNAMPDSQKKVILVLLAIVEAVTPVLLVVGKAITAFGQVYSVAGKLVTGLGKLWGVFAANPVLIVVAVLAAIVAAFIHLWNTSESFRNFWINLWNGITSTLSSAWETIKNIITVGIMLIASIISAAVQIITLPWRFIWENCKEYIIEAWNYIKAAVSSALGVISSVISNAWNIIANYLTRILSNIKNKFVSEWNAIKSHVSSAINGIKSSISNGLNGAKSTVTGVLNSIRSAFSSVWDGCKNIVGNAIGHIKSLMNFSWSLPSLKLPHFSISGKFSLHPPSVPKLGIEWYKKAMDDGMIMNQPTIFGYNAKSNQFLAGGEAGSETVVGTQNLMDMIQEAVNNAGSGNGDSEATRALLEAIFNWMRNGGLYKLLIDVLTNGVEFEFDNREIARLVKKYA